VEVLGDFTTTLRVLAISGLAIVIGAVCAVLASVLLRLIGLFTNLFYSWTLEHRDGFSSWKSLGNLCCFRAGGRRAGHWSDFSLLLVLSRLHQRRDNRILPLVAAIARIECTRTAIAWALIPVHWVIGPFEIMGAKRS
jgi:hypothetical protein